MREEAVIEIQKNKRSFDYPKETLICPSCSKRLDKGEEVICLSGVRCPRCLGVYTIEQWFDNDDTCI